jgi:hypothetical protein
VEGGGRHDPQDRAELRRALAISDATFV